MRPSASHGLGLLALAGTTFGTYFDDMYPGAKDMFTQSMKWLDSYYDSDAGYLYDLSSSAALRHETRPSVWYALGLLARNTDNDVSEAEKIITNVISGQYKVESEEWYGDYQIRPEEPYVGSPKYPPRIYGSWDPNWRGFISTSLIVAMEEFQDVLSEDTQQLILESLRNATVGDSYRFGTLDNLFPGYSNPAIMRAFTSGWTGRRLQEENMTRAGEDYANEIISLFNQHDTLSEFNSGTYTGVSMYGLTLWSIYLPSDSIMKENGKRMLQETWKSVAELWHPDMRNLAGPWDRTYGYDMNRYLSIISLWMWPLIGRAESGLVSTPQAMSHAGDYAWAPVFAVLANAHYELLPEGVAGTLGTFKGEHTYKASAVYPPYDNAYRNFTTWLSDKISIGAESFDQTNLGGAIKSQSAFNPAVIQWDTGKEISWIALYPTEKAVQVKVEPNRLTLSYPKGTSASTFRFIVGTFTDKRTLAGWQDVQGLRVNLTGNVNPKYALEFGGQRGGRKGVINQFEFWDFVYSMPSGFTGVPKVVLDVQLI